MSYSVKVTMPSKKTNSKVGNMPTSTTSNVTCPDACPLKAAGCYAEQGPLGMQWRALSKANAGDRYTMARGNFQSLAWDQFCETVASFPADQLWRHNQAGDLPGISDTIDIVALASLVEANKGRNGFTFTHKPISNSENRAAIASANASGFTINLSANNLAHADQLSEANIGPVAVVLSSDVHGNVKLETPAGRKVAVCPATYRDDVTCASCGLCQRQNRKVIVGFPAHGACKKKASAVALS